MNDSLYQDLKRYSEHISRCFDVSCGIYDLYQNEIGYQNRSVFCTFCKSCAYQSTHLYGCFEAERWNGKYIYYCPMGMIFIANIVRSYLGTEAALITGPILMGEQEDLDIVLPPDIEADAAPLPNITTSKVNDICELIHGITLLLSESDQEDYLQADKLTMELNNRLYEIGETVDANGKTQYPIEEEKELISAISTGDKETAQELLNRLLGHIYFNSGGDFKIIKARVNELLVLLSRASIDGGADIEQIFWTNNTVIGELQTLRDINELNVWLSSMMHRYISYVFDLTDIKHVDIIHKATGYIKQHYTSKLTLDEVAKFVYLSKSYLSKIFKEELHCNFANYVNNLRVEKSKILLMDQSINLIDLAAMVGFEDQSYFTKVFKKVVGVSPGKYRENRGNTLYKKEK